ncbi:uncharacterized protein EAF01_011993 [Botrytis porri]|uniref:uncharacterized protein n=1 Tax=Botrytis porri TaxID=87229 RepID=UPI0018FF4FD5|nr:uncharacterized protein EAF01_011993 [Botrytis porri]KAF7880724.1 hypothetical protein EAF01_011993 [Botrytis porri]
MFTLIGGRASVPLAILIKSTATITPSTQRVSVFSFMYSTALAAAILGFRLSSATMKSLGNYAAHLVGLALMSLALCLSLLLPMGEVAQSPASEPEIDSASVYTNISDSRMQRINSRHAVIGYFKNLLQIRGAIPLSIAGFFVTLGQRVQILILQYMPEQFSIIVLSTRIGLSSLLQSIFVELFSLEYTAFATILISTMKSMGDTFSRSIYFYTFALSLDMDEVLQGLPFIVSAACFVVVASVLITMAKTPRVRRDIS